jgi:hypothetical protein
VPKKARAKDSDQSGTSFLDYPESMSLYERESLAAEVKLAERKNKSKPKKDSKRKNPVASRPPQGPHP